MIENEAMKNLETLERFYRIAKSGSALHEVLINFVTLEDLVVAIQALEEIQKYRAIGTIEEFKALKEKSVAKKVVVEHIPKTSWTKEISHYLCPSCRSIFSFGGKPYCSKCGQKIDWE